MKPQFPPNTPIMLGMHVDSDVHEALVTLFVLNDLHPQDGIDALAFLFFDQGCKAKDLAVEAIQIVQVLNRCKMVCPDQEVFQDWKTWHMNYDIQVRLVTGTPGKPTHIRSWPIALGYWLLAGKPVNMESGAEAVSAFAHRGVTLTQAIDTIVAVLQEPEPTQRIFAELLRHHALLNEELDGPSNAVALLHSKDLEKLVSLWRSGGRKRRLRSVAQRVTRDERNLSKRWKSKSGEPAEHIPPKPTSLPVAPLPALPKPASLPALLEAHLPTKVQPIASTVATALLLLKNSNELWTIDTLTDRIQRMAGTARQIAKRLVEDAFKWLTEHGVVEAVNGYRLRKESSCPIGSQILSLV